MNRAHSKALLSSALLAALALAGCTTPQRPFQFIAPPLPDAADAAARALAANGHAPASIDRQAGIVLTKWEDTGFNYGFVQNQPASIVRRFTVTLAPGPAGTNVVVRMDAKRCQKGGFTIGDLDVRGPCEALDGILEQQQREVDQLGLSLRQALLAPR